MSNLVLDAPNITMADLEGVKRALASGHISTFGPYVEEFEERLERYLGAPVVCMSSGTAALEMALRSACIGPGDKVIVPSLTFVGTVNAIHNVGATPVIVDVFPDTWCINVRKVKEVIDKDTTCIMPVHIYGNPCNMDEIKDLGLIVIEDAAEAMGSIYAGKFCGTIGDYGTISFNGNKIMTTGGGGALVCKDKDRIKDLINQCKSGIEPGYNYRMINLVASLGLAQLERIPQFIVKKWEIFRTWRENLEGVNWQKENGYSDSNRWFSACTSDRELPLVSRKVFYPLHLMPYWKQFAPKRCEVSERIYEKGYCLASSTVNDIKDIEREAKNGNT